MSDFGAIISVKKIDESQINNQEFNDIVNVSEQTRRETELTNSLSNPYLFKVGKTNHLDKAGCFEVNILLSNHYGNTSDFDWHKEVEIKDIEIIANSFSKILSKKYKLQAVFDWW